MLQKKKMKERIDSKYNNQGGLLIKKESISPKKSPKK